jgi:hypothetical protein
MGRKVLTYLTNDNRGHCEIHVDAKNEVFYIKYFDSNGKQFYTEDFPNKSLRYVEDAAENWVLGIKKLEDV